MIEVEGLSKVFPATRRTPAKEAVRDVSFRCLPGQVYALLGPNGAGKTCTLRMIATTLQPTRGSVRVASADQERVRERERARIARELHDQLGQALTGLKIDLAQLGSDAIPERDDSTCGRLQASVDELIATVRRIASELRPHLLDDLGLLAALEFQAQDFVRRTGVKCRFRCRGIPGSLDTDRSTALFRIFQEILTNVGRHAAATKVKVEVDLDAANFTLRVSDNGKGFDKLRLADPKALGLLGMRERALLLGGAIEIESRTGAGTVVTLKIPLAGTAAA